METPNTRIDSAKSAMGIINSMVSADEPRARHRSKVSGLIDGNPPYSREELVKAGLGWSANYNSREAEAYVTMAHGAFYDILSEAPTYALVTCKYGDEKSPEFSQIITEEFDCMLKENTMFDYNMQMSQYEMVKFGAGPLVNCDPLDWMPEYIPYGNLRVQDKVKSIVDRWPLCSVQNFTTVDRAYDFISNEDIATKAGWSVSAVKRSIAKAAPDSGSGTDWEEMQRRIRNNDLGESYKCSELKWHHLFVKEKDGKISHYIVDENNDSEFIYQSRSKYGNWNKLIFPFYYDKGNGYHHGVKGMGVKMYGIMELKNRLKNTIYNSAIMRSGLTLQATSENANQVSSIIPRGGNTIIPKDLNVIQNNFSGALDAPMAVDQDLDNLLAGNLSQYRQRIDKPQGNPRTAREIDAIVAQQSTLGKTQLARYFVQLDDLYKETYSRAINKNLTPGKEYADAAIAFVKRCKDRGVPYEAMKTAKVMASRIAGQGSQMMRSQNLGEVLGMAASFPEAGRNNALSDWLASKVGQSMVSRYNPKATVSQTDEDQAALIALEHSAMKSGVMPVVSGTNNHTLHATQHMQTASAAIQSLEENPGGYAEVSVFLQVAVAHIAQHLQRIITDPIRDNDAKILAKQFQQLQQHAQDVLNHAQSMQQQEQSAAQPDQTEDQIELEKMQREEARKDAVTQADINRKNVKTKHQMALADAKSASGIRRSSVEAAAKAKTPTSK